MLVSLFLLSAISGLASSQTSTKASISSTTSGTVERWDDLGVLATRAITELSRVCIVLSRRDYSLTAGGPYTYIQYPSSYRATLTQGTDLVDNAFRTTQSSVSRVQMITGLVPNQVDTIVSLLFEASTQEREAFLPSELKGLASKATNAASAIESITQEWQKVVAFFEEVLRAVQPSAPSTTTSATGTSTSTQTAKSPLDIDHATSISTLLSYFNGLIATWTRLAQRLNTAAEQTNRATQFINNRNALLSTLSSFDQVANLASILSSAYTPFSIKAVTPHSASMSSYLMLQSEQERLTTVGTVDLRATNNIPIIQRVFAQAMVDHATHNTERNERFRQLAASP